jgi:hypothetical protein
MSLSHDPEVVQQWLAANGLAVHGLRYHCFILSQPGSERGAVLANTTVCLLLSMLGEIDDDRFDVAKLKFTDAGSKGAKADAKKEIVGLVLKILSTFGAHVNDSQALAIIEHAPDKFDKRIRLAIYRAKGEYEKALEIMIEDNYGADEIQGFCRAAPDPTAALTAFLHVLPPALLLESYGDFLIANLPLLDLVELVSRIPDDVPVKSVKGLVQSALALIAVRDQNLDSQIAITKALLIDGEYQRAQTQATFVDIPDRPTCAKCSKAIGAEELFVVPATKALYHSASRP